jgi:hypothetical protein
MAAPIPGSTMRSVLLTIQDISGSQYKTLLERANLSHYLTNMPPDDMRPGGTSDELIRLFATTYTMMGEPLTRLFMRNFGTRAVKGMLEMEWVQQERTTLAALPPEQRLSRFVHDYAPIMSQTWAPVIVSEDATAFYMALEFCVACQGIRGTHAPICAAGDVIFRTMAEYTTGQRVRVAEVECAALGAAHCKHALYKPAAGGV